MKYVVNIHAYDCIDHISYSAQIREYADYENGPGEIVWALHGTYPGIGADTPDEWACHLLDELSHRL